MKIPTLKASALAIIISLVAALFTGLQWYEVHSQFMLMMRPSINFETAVNFRDPPVGIAVVNNGPGPATVKSWIYYVDHKSIKDWEEVAKIAHVNPDHLIPQELDEGDTLAVNNKYWLLKYQNKGDKNLKDLEHFADFVDDHLAIQITYCSLLGKCWEKCSTKDYC